MGKYNVAILVQDKADTELWAKAGTPEQATALLKKVLDILEHHETDAASLLQDEGFFDMWRE